MTENPAITAEDRLKAKIYFYNSIAGQFDSRMNMYDAKKRIVVFFDELLGHEQLRGKKLLDAGCGTGWFSKAAVERGALVTSFDIGENLLAEVKKKCESNRVLGSVLEMPFASDSFDYIVSSEVIEHVVEPYTAIREMFRVLKPGGLMILSTPNKIWKWTLFVANLFNLRPYQGLENWSGWRQLKKELLASGFEIEKMEGIHLVPFVHPLTYPVNNFFHRFNSALGPLMVNIAVRCKKK